MRSSLGIRATSLVFVVLAAMAGAGCVSMPRSGMGAGMGAAPQPAPRAIAPTRLSASERAFAIKAVAQGMYEVEVSRLASERALHSGVRSYALAMANQHKQVNDELVSLLSVKGVAPPKGLAADTRAKLHRLASLPASTAFDHGYVRVVGIEDHQAKIALFEREKARTRDRDLLAWIDRTLVMLRGHLAAAQGLAGALAG